MSFLVFVVVLLALFGPKIAGVLDLSVLGGLLGAMFLMNLKTVPVSREYIVVIICVVVIAIHSLGMALINGAEDIQPVLRSFRALISTSLLGVFFYIVGSSGALTSSRLTSIVIVVLLVNAIAIIISTVSPSVKPILAELYGFDKKFVPLRSAGLTAGYDTAGYLCVVGAALAAINGYFKKGMWHPLVTVIFVAAAFLTSRSSMVLTGVLMIGVCVAFVAKGRWALKSISLVYIAAGAAVATMYVMPLILATLSLGSSGPDIGQFTGNFAATDLSRWYESMWFLPEHYVGVMFGTGSIAEESDVGYVLIISMIGFVGLSYVILMHLYMFLVVRKLNRSIRYGHLYLDSESRALATTLLVFLFLMFFFNIKNLYFLTRGYHELLVILFFFVLGIRKAAIDIECAATSLGPIRA